MRGRSAPLFSFERRGDIRMRQLGSGRVMAKAVWVRRAAAAWALGLIAIVGGCGSSDDDNTNYQEQSVEVLYNRALDELGQQDYKHAAKSFEEVDRQHPYSVLAIFA